MKYSRRQFVVGSGLAAAAGAWAPVRSWAGVEEPPGHAVDFAMVLSRAGVWEASQEIGLDSERVFRPLAQRTNHPYRSYRWSVSYAETGGPLIQALPPEEEMGWMPWEEWLALEGKPVRRAMVLYPVREMTRRVPRWWCLEKSHDLTPRRVAPPPTLEALFRRDRIFEAARVVKFDVDKTLLAPLSPRARQIYLGMRWSIAPHRLAADLPVIQCLPPADKRREWPWETWYTDGKTPLIHHVHLTVPNNRTEPKSWRERDGAPQRPAELFGANWYWYNDLNMAPALAKA
ncbi:MAG: hypothetical protein NT154_17695 [Verrucomicrobia bacterium]|nr:hypothetical protein [Verrucomicrobiota bacterium]